MVRHQAALLVDLAVGEGVLLALVRVLTALVLDADRRTDQLQHAAVGVLQVTRVRLGNLVGLVAVDHDQRRVGTTKVGIAQLDAAAIDQWWLVLAHGIFEDLRQAAGRPAGHRRLERGLHRLVQVAHAGAVQGGNEVDVGEIDEEQPALQLGLHVVTLARLHAVPLVQGDDDSAAGFQGEAQQVQVVVHHAFAGVHDEDHHVGVLDRLQRLHHRELLDFLVDLAALAHAGGVDEGVLLVIALERDVDTVAGGARLVVHHHALLAEHAVDQGRLADVGAADDGDLDTILLARARDAHRLFAFGDFGVQRFFDLVAWQVAEHSLHQRIDAAALGAGHRDGVAHAQRRELCASHIGIDVVDLVGNQDRFLVPLAQVLGDHLVGSGHAGPGIDQEQHIVGFFNGHERLLGHFLVHAHFVTGDTAGVDQDEGTTLPAGITILAVTGQARQVTDDGIAGFGQAVEHGGFADVRAAHQGDYGNHSALHS